MLTNLFAAVVLIVGAIYLVRPREPKEWMTSFAVVPLWP
jgi:hypothetical protein